MTPKINGLPKTLKPNIPMPPDAYGLPKTL